MDKIIGYGNALVDVLAKIDDDSILDTLNLPKGGMTLVDGERFNAVSELLHRLPTRMVTGGSAGNTILSLAKLGVETGILGKVGCDDFGSVLRSKFEEHHVAVHFKESAVLPTGVCSAFVSPDGERTMATFLGAGNDMRAEEIEPDVFSGYKSLYVEGYMVQNHDLVVRVMQLAKSAGMHICLDLASFTVVMQEREFFLRLIREYADIVFANEEEAHALTGLDAEKAIDIIATHCSIAVVKMGSRGSMIRKGDTFVRVPAQTVEQVIDTTGAGDNYAAGFLYGLFVGCSLERCANLGTTLAAQVIQVMGATPPDEAIQQLKIMSFAN